MIDNDLAFFGKKTFRDFESPTPPEFAKPPTPTITPRITRWVVLTLMACFKVLCKYVVYLPNLLKSLFRKNVLRLTLKMSFLYVLSDLMLLCQGSSGRPISKRSWRRNVKMRESIRSPTRSQLTLQSAGARWTRWLARAPRWSAARQPGELSTSTSPRRKNGLKTTPVCKTKTVSLSLIARLSYTKISVLCWKLFITMQCVVLKGKKLCE